MFSKKSCLSCAFCLHCRDTFYGFPNPELDRKKDNLTDAEISLLKNGDVSFLSEAKRKHDDWVATYEKRKEEKDKEQYLKRIEASKKPSNSLLEKIFGKDYSNIGFVISEKPSIVPLLGGDPYPRREELGMEPCPIAPDHEYLECWKENWGKQDEDIWTTLKSKKCRNYYPLSKKETKSLEACDEERKEKADYRKFWRGVGVGFLSAVIVMLLRFLLAPYFSEKNTNSTIYFQNENLNKNEISSLEGKNITNKMQSATEKRK